MITRDELIDERMQIDPCCNPLTMPLCIFVLLIVGIMFILDTFRVLFI